MTDTPDAPVAAVVVEVAKFFRDNITTSCSVNFSLMITNMLSLFPPVGPGLADNNFNKMTNSRMVHDQLHYGCVSRVLTGYGDRH